MIRCILTSVIAGIIVYCLELTITFCINALIVMPFHLIKQKSVQSYYDYIKKDYRHTLVNSIVGFFLLLVLFCINIIVSYIFLNGRKRMLILFLGIFVFFFMHKNRSDKLKSLITYPAKLFLSIIYCLSLVIIKVCFKVFKFVLFLGRIFYKKKRQNNSKIVKYLS